MCAFKLALVAIVSLILATVHICQTPAKSTSKPKGKVRSVVNQRTYFVEKGQQIPPRTEVTATMLFNIDGRVVQESIFGNGEERTTYQWTGDTYTASVAFYDLNGTLRPELSNSFRPLTNEVPQAGLCPEYTTKREKDSVIKPEREIQICSDRSIRRTTTYEFTANGDLSRMVVEDAKGRTWEYENTFGLNFKLAGFKYTVNDLTEPKYWQEVTLTSEQFDEYGNEIAYMASGYHSSYPGQIRYQYLSQNKITYYK
jgi:hypothetical protein